MENEQTILRWFKVKLGQQIAAGPSSAAHRASSRRLNGAAKLSSENARVLNGHRLASDGPSGANDNSKFTAGTSLENGVSRHHDELSRLLDGAIEDLVSSERAAREAVETANQTKARSAASASDAIDLGESAVEEAAADGQFDDGRPVPLWKRILDVGMVVLMLPLWLPVMLFTIAWIKLASPGPIFYRQKRVGYRGRHFMILKFRTMHVNVETQIHESHLEQLIQKDVPMTKLDSAGDPRLIPGGRFFRAAGLDELPQLFNILSGDMSLVGPRPCTPHEFSYYHASQLERFDAPPGLTGYWQINGKNKTTFSEMIEMDVFYARNMSLKCDLTIMIKTPIAVIGQILESYGTPRFEWKSTSEVAPIHGFPDSRRQT